MARYIGPNVSAPRLSAPSRRLETLFGDTSIIKPSRFDTVVNEELIPDQRVQTLSGAPLRDRPMIVKQSRRGEFEDKIYDNVGSQGQNPRAYLSATPRKNGEVDFNGRTSAPVTQGGFGGAVRFIDKVRASANAEQVFSGANYDGVNFRGASRAGGHTGAFMDDPENCTKERRTVRALAMTPVAGFPVSPEEKSVSMSPYLRQHINDPGVFSTQIGGTADRIGISAPQDHFSGYNTPVPIFRGDFTDAGSAKKMFA